MTGFSLTGVQRQTRSPLVTDDINAGAQPGYVWVDTVSLRMWVCTSNTAGSAVWAEIASDAARPINTLRPNNLINYSKARTPTVAIIGDSTATESADVLFASETIWQLLTRELQRQNSDKSHLFFNRAIGGANFSHFTQTGASTGLTLPSWFTNSSLTWASYLRDLAPDLLFICCGINTADAAQIQHIRTFLLDVVSWPKVPDIIFVTNKMANPLTTNPIGLARNNQLAQSSGIRHLVRAQANGLGISGLPNLGMIDIGRYYCEAFEGFDPCDQRLEASTFTTTVTAFPYALPECDGDFDLRFTFPSQTAAALLTGSNQLYISLASFLSAGTPWHRVAIRAGGTSTVGTDIYTETGPTQGNIVGVSAPDASTLDIRVICRDERLVVVINGTTTVNASIAKYQHRFQPTISFMSSPPGGTSLAVQHWRPGRRRLTQPFLSPVQVWGSSSGNGNAINHLTSEGVRAVDAPVIEAQSFRWLNETPSDNSYLQLSETVQTGRRVSTMTNRSGTITSAGVAQVLAAENLDRRGFWVQNVSTGDLWISTVASASAEQPSMLLKPNTFFEMPPDAVATNAISIFGATAGQAFSAREWN